jgi:hypothetical protein
MSATFRCLISGQTVTFEHQVDIDSMKGHPDYERVEEQQEEAPVAEEAPKKAGRPAKKTVEATPEVE